MPKYINVSNVGDVAVLRVDNPPVNALSPGVPEALLDAIAAAGRDASIHAIVIMGAGRTFIAGADIATLQQAAFGDLGAAADLHDLLARIEDSRKPIVMAIHGTALGGGLELAMAGHYRVAVPSALVGQPEVNLGIIPGAEGTQRLPRLVGIQTALDMCVTGKPIKAPQALAAGLLDAVIDGDLTVGAVDFARRAAARTTIPRTRERSDRLGTPAANAPLYAAARELAAKTRKKQLAPLKAVDAIEAAATLPYAEGCRRERELFFECVQTEQAKALIHVFFAERAVTKIPGVGADTPAAPVERVAIIGAGTMGGGIAMACTNAGVAVVLRDATQAAVDTGVGRMRANYDQSVARGRLTPADVDQRMARVAPSVAGAALEPVDLVIEAVYENLKLKQEIFSEIDRLASGAHVLASNTSTLDIDAIASATSRPDRVVGLHFFSPAQVMRLVEIVRGAATSPAVLATAMVFAKRLGKVPVVVGNCRGFVGNRMMFPYMYEAQFLVEEGATPSQVDKVLTDFGMAMGIFAVDDMAGLDVAWRVRQELGHFTEPGVRRPLVADKLNEMGRYGQKTGRGWYRYEDARKATPDPEVEQLIRTTAQQAGIEQRPIDDSEILDRCLYSLINEGARILADGSAHRASDIDVIYVNGYGFPAWRGGPMFYADRVGLPKVLARIEEFHRRLGERWTPAPLLVALAREGRTFNER